MAKTSCPASPASLQPFCRILRLQISNRRTRWGWQWRPRGMDRTTSARRRRQEAPPRGRPPWTHLLGAARLVADRAARPTIRDPSGGHTRDAECRGVGAARRGIALNLGTGHYGTLDAAAGGSPAPHRRATSTPEMQAESHNTPAAYPPTTSLK